MVTGVGARQTCSITCQDLTKHLHSTAILYHLLHSEDLIVKVFWTIRREIRMGEAQNLPGDHQLWVSLSALGDGNVFAILPQLMKNMLMDDLPSDLDDFVDVILPSDDTWQTKIYYKLVEKQRLTDAAEEAMLDPVRDEKEVKLHEWNIISKPKNIPCDSTIKWYQKRGKKVGPGPITWTVSDIAKAGCLLTNPPINSTFEDEQEMRRVYTLIYDVFRYKSVLAEALNDVLFFQIFPQLLTRTSHVWLLFYDLYHRSFKRRETNVASVASKLFDAAGLSFPENALWAQRIKLAASIARLRIKHNALSISELLPQHLKDERVTEQAKHVPVTCWVNSRKSQDANSLCKEIEEKFQLKPVHNLKDLGQKNYKWDVHCPQIIAFHASMRPSLARSDLVRGHKLIVQDKSFCLGPATFGKVVSDLELTGSVIQTHVNSPRTTAYLATLLSHNERIKKLMAFSAGKRKTEYESYFNELGMTNILIFSDRLIDSPPDAHYMEEVVAVFATPPNSYSAVTDPIDLVCSRGGDLSMLEVLTESEDSNAGRERVANILEEQRKTLRFAMSRPQIQFVLYETHSELDAENNSMVRKALKDINRIAKLHHATLQGKLPSADSILSTEINNNEKSEVVNEEGESSVSKRPSVAAKLSLAQPDSQESFLEKIVVPDTDLFDIPMLPALCPSDASCQNFQKQGCYLALLQRKQIIRLDDKYMIQMAENRGLFGSTTTTSTNKSKSSRASKKKAEKQEVKHKSKRRVKDVEIQRISAPTHAFLRHTVNCPSEHFCSRCQTEDTATSVHVTQSRRWWSEATRHILALKSSLIQQKMLPAKKQQHNLCDRKTIVNFLAKNVARVDEIAAKSNLVSRIPVFPKLRLSRDFHVEKVQVPLPITTVKFPSDTSVNLD